MHIIDTLVQMVISAPGNGSSSAHRATPGVRVQERRCDRSDDSAASVNGVEAALAAAFRGATSADGACGAEDAGVATGEHAVGPAPGVGWGVPLALTASDWLAQFRVVALRGHGQTVAASLRSAQSSEGGMDS